MRLTFPHYYPTPTGRPVRGAAAWDEMRATESPFGVPRTRADWVAIAESRDDLRRAADDLATLATGLGAGTLASYGVGAGLLEYHLSKRVELRCGDFAPAAAARLEEIAPELHMRVHDLIADAPLPADCHLLHRLDTEFKKSQWRAILGRFEEPVIFVPSGRLQLRGAWSEIRCRLSGGRHAGWVRSEASLRALAPRGMKVQSNGATSGFVLAPPEPV